MGASDEAARDAAHFGLILIEDDDGEGNDDGVWPEHVEAVTAFLAVCTQWRRVTAGDGSVRLAGLDYAGVRAGFDLAGIGMTTDLWSQVQLIEYGARAASQEAEA